MYIAGYEHDVVPLADYEKLKADADRLAEALALLFAGDEVGLKERMMAPLLARAALKAHEDLGGTV